MNSNLSLRFTCIRVICIISHIAVQSQEITNSDNDEDNNNNKNNDNNRLSHFRKRPPSNLTQTGS